MNILVVGATGGTGRKLVEQLKKKNHEPIAMVRDGADTSGLPADVERRCGDVEALERSVLKGVDAIIFAAGSGSKTGPEKTIDVDQEGAKALIDLAKAEGISHFVMLSAKGVDSPEAASEGMRHYMRAKRDADDYLIASGLDYTIVRPVLLTHNAGTGRVTLAETVDPHTEVSREDVAAILAQSLDVQTARNRIFELTSGGTPVEDALEAA